MWAGQGFIHANKASNQLIKATYCNNNKLSFLIFNDFICLIQEE